MQSIWEKKTCFRKSVSLSMPFLSKQHLFEVIRSHEMQLIVFVKEQFLQTSLQINFRPLSFAILFKSLLTVISKKWDFEMLARLCTSHYIPSMHLIALELRFDDKSFSQCGWYAKMATNKLGFIFWSFLYQAMEAAKITSQRVFKFLIRITEMAVLYRYGRKLFESLPRSNMP